MSSSIDVKIQHVTPADANIFSELGFSGEEAEQLFWMLNGKLSNLLRSNSN